MATTNWKVTREEAETIGWIARRYVAEFGGDLTGVSMDITAAHANGCTLDLDGLLDADGFNFAHDVTGITRHIDRETGQIVGGFLPRFARKED